VDITNRQSKELTGEETLTGAGFQVRSPGFGLYPVKNLPRRGAITFRPTEPMLDGMVYFVTPFPSTASTYEQALAEWNSIPATKGFKVSTVEQRSTTFKGSAAREALIQVDQGSGGQIAAILIVGRPGNYFILNRGDRFSRPNERANVIRRCKTGLQKLKAVTQINNG